MAASWMILEAYRENGEKRRELIESGLSRDEAEETARDFTQNLRDMGITGHWAEAVPEISERKEATA